MESAHCYLCELLTNGSGIWSGLVCSTGTTLQMVKWISHSFFICRQKRTTEMSEECAVCVCATWSRFIMTRTCYCHSINLSNSADGWKWFLAKTFIDTLNFALCKCKCECVCVWIGLQIDLKLPLNWHFQNVGWANWNTKTMNTF